MRITLFLLLFGVIQVMAKTSYSQTTRLTLNLQDVSIEQVLDEIENQSEFYFLSNQKLVDTERKINVRMSDMKIGEVLDQIFSKTNTDYVVMDRQIVLTPREYLAEVKATLQPRTITGIVSDQDGVPLIGVSITVKGTVTGTISDAEGKYSLSDIPDNATLVFSFIGMLTQEINISNQTSINVTMEADAIGLEELVVIGYGTVKKSDLTGSVSSIRGDKLNSDSQASVDQIIQGRIPGVQVTQSSAEPGGGFSIRIRGTNSITAGN
ncbi:MAG: carboxypeptidase-like regulatory domain-containing protein, partial [Bacteroidota bacterium]